MDVVFSRIDSKVRKLAEEVAKAKGITLSEHIRELIIKDLDNRGLFDSKLKESLKANTSWKN